MLLSLRKKAAQLKNKIDVIIRQAAGGHGQPLPFASTEAKAGRTTTAFLVTFVSILEEWFYVPTRTHDDHTIAHRSQHFFCSMFDMHSQRQTECPNGAVAFECKDAYADLQVLGILWLQ